MGAEAILGLPETEAARVAGRHGSARRPEPRQQGIVRCDRRRHEHLGRPAQEERLGQPLRVAGLAHPEVGGRHVHQRHAEVVGGPPQRREEVVETAVEEAGVGDSPRGDEPDDLAADELAPFPLRGLHLVADGDLQPGPDQPRDVGVHGVMRDPGHGDRALPLLPRGQRDIERAGGHRRVLVKRLVEVSEAEEQEVVRIAALPLLVLAHHRREGREIDVGRRRGGRVVGRAVGRRGRGRRVRHRMRGRSGSGARDLVAHQGRGWKVRRTAATAPGRGRGPALTC